MSNFDGLKNNFKYYNESITDTTEINVSLNKGNSELNGVKLNNTNVYKIHKLYSSPYHFPFSIELMHSTAFDENEIKHNYKLNNYLEIVEANAEKIIVKLWDEGEYEFLYNEEKIIYYSSELNAYLEDFFTYYVLKLDGDIKLYYEYGSNYPYKIERSTVDILLYELETYNSSKRIKKITNAALESATFTYTGENLTNIFIEKQGLTEGTSARKSIDLEYSTFEERTILTKIETKIIDELDNEDIVKTVLIGETKETDKRTFFVNNTTIGEGVEIIIAYSSNTIDATKIFVYKYYQGNCYQTWIYKKENHTKIENCNLLPAGSTGADERIYTNIYFKNNQNVDFEVSHDGVITYYLYNENNQLITFLKSKLILPEKTNLLESLTYSSDAGNSIDSIEIEDKYKFTPYNENESLLVTSPYVYDNVITTKIPLNLNNQKLEVNDIYSIRFLANKIITTLSDISASIYLTYVDLDNNEFSTQEYLVNLPNRTKTDEETLNEEVEYKYNIFEFKIPKSYKQVNLVINMISTDYKNGIILHYLSAEKRNIVKNYEYYSDVNKVKEVSNELSKITYKYDETGKLNRVINDKKSNLNINYNEGKISSVSSNYGFNVMTNYNLLELPTQEVCSNRTKNMKSRKLYSYYKETEFLHKETDEVGRITTYEPTDQYKLDYTIQPNNRIDNVDYDELERVNELIFDDDVSKLNNENTNNVLFTYDIYDRIETITKSDGTKYKFVYLYDKLNKVVQLLDNEEKVIVEYNYVIDDNLFMTDLIKSKKYGTSDNMYTFTYDKYGKPIEVKYGDSTLGTYTYDKYNYLMFKNDSLSSRKTYFEYLDSEKLKRMCVTDLDSMTDISDIYYTYNTEGKLISKDKYLIDSDDVIRECTRDCYNSIERSTLSSPEILHEELKKIEDLYVCSFIDNNNLINKDDDEIIPTTQGSIVNSTIPYYPCISVLSYNRQITSMNTSNLFMGCTCTNISTGIVMDLRNSTSNFRIETRITSDYYTEVNVYTTVYENCILTLKSLSTLREGINNIGLRVLKDGFTYKIVLLLNSETIEDYVDESYLNYTNTTLIYSYGGTKAANLLKYNNYSGKLYNIFLSTNGEAVSTEFDNIVNLCYDYIENNKNIIDNPNIGNLPYYSNITHIKQDYYDRVLSSEVSTFAFPLINDYYPLMPNYQSFEIDIEDKCLNNNTIDREFDFDNDKNTYVSKILERMTFNPFFTTKGLVQFDLNIGRLDGESKIFRFKNDDVSLELIVSPNDNTSYYLYLSDSTYEIKLNYNEWNNIEVKYIYGSYYSVTLTVGDFTDTKIYNSSITPTKMLIEFTKEKAFGHISQLLTHKDYFGNSFNVNKTITNTKKYDELSRLKSINIKNDINNVINKTFNYKSNGSYNTYTISNEIIKTNLAEEKYVYTYDSLGNLLTIKKNDVVINSYTYDKLGQLLSETTNDVTTTYTYDKAGNVLTNGNKVYSYDEYKRLESITDGTSTKIFEYDDKYYLNPVKIKTSENDDNPILLDYQGKRLIKYSKGTDEIEFTYDLNGNRTRKKIGNKTYNYIYEGNLLIKEDHNGVEIKYLYDDQNLLYGFIVDTDTYYYYKRDIFQNILGIIDEEGNEIVTYKYDAWGNIISETYTNETVKNLNSFKYKGYYYDVETQLYWVSSRYYSPELCRWISPDSIEYLDPQSINGLNLYAYCGNDPVM